MVRFGEPMRFRGDPDDDDAKMDQKVEKVKDVIRKMLRDTLRKRKSIWT